MVGLNRILYVCPGKEVKWCNILGKSGRTIGLPLPVHFCGNFLSKSPKLQFKKAEGFPSSWNSVSLIPLFQNQHEEFFQHVLIQCVHQKVSLEGWNTLCFKRAQWSLMERVSFVLPVTAREWVLPHIPMFCLNLYGEMKVSLSLSIMFAVKGLLSFSCERMLHQNL